MLRHHKHLMFLTVTGLLLGTMSLAYAKSVRNAKYTGAVGKSGGYYTSNWSTWVDVPPSTIKARITSWRGIRRMLKKPLNFKLKSSSATSAVFYFERASPIPLMSNPHLTIRAEWTDLPDGSAKMTWTLLKGTPKTLKSTWIIRAEGTGSRVENRASFSLSFDPPSWALGDRAAEMGAAIERFRQHVGAKQLRAKAP